MPLVRRGDGPCALVEHVVGDRSLVCTIPSANCRSACALNPHDQIERVRIAHPAELTRFVALMPVERQSDGFISRSNRAIFFDLLVAPL